jgi:hypothetical protein
MPYKVPGYSGANAETKGVGGQPYSSTKGKTTSRSSGSKSTSATPSGNAQYTNIGGTWYVITGKGMQVSDYNPETNEKITPSSSSVLRDYGSNQIAVKTKVIGQYFDSKTGQPTTSDNPNAVYQSYAQPSVAMQVYSKLKQQQAAGQPLELSAAEYEAAYTSKGFPKFPTGFGKVSVMATPGKGGGLNPNMLGIIYGDKIKIVEGGLSPSLPKSIPGLTKGEAQLDLSGSGYQVKEYKLSDYGLVSTPVVELPKGHVDYQVKEFNISGNAGEVLNTATWSQAQTKRGGSMQVLGFNIPNPLTYFGSVYDSTKAFVEDLGFVDTKGLRIEESNRRYELAMQEYDLKGQLKQYKEAEQLNLDYESAKMMGKSGEYSLYSDESIEQMRKNIKTLQDTSGIEQRHSEYITQSKYLKGVDITQNAVLAGMIVTAPLSIGIAGIAPSLVSLGTATIAGTAVGIGGTLADVAIFGPSKPGEWNWHGALVNAAAVRTSMYVGGKTYQGIAKAYSKATGKVPDVAVSLDRAIAKGVNRGESIAIAKGKFIETDVFGTKTYSEMVLGEKIVTLPKGMSIGSSDFMINTPSLIGTRNIAASTKSLTTTQGKPTITNNADVLLVDTKAGISKLPQYTQKMDLVSRFQTTGHEILGLGKMYWNKYIGQSGVSYMKISFWAGLGLIATGFYVHTSVLYIGYGSPVNVITYDITGDAVNGFSNPVVGLFFELSGFIVWVIAILIEIYGGSDALKEGGVKQNGR